MGLYFANGRNQLPTNSWNITVNNTGGNLLANSYYFSLQARNRVGLTLPLYSSLITVANNNSITFTINSAAKESGEEWISYVISANTINQGISYCQIAEIPLINLNTNLLNSFPLTLTLNNQEHLKLNNIVANNTLFPTVAIHGMCRGLTSTGLIYKYNTFDTITPSDNLYTFNGISGKWKATGRFTTYITSVTDVDGCSQDIRDITDPSSIVIPKYNPTGTSSNSITLWLTSTKVVTKGTRISVAVKLGELNKSQLFDGLLELKFKGFVNTTTGIKRTTLSDNVTPLDDIDVLYKYDANNPTLILADELAVGEAYILEVSCNFQSAEIEDYIVNGSYISIYPEFTASASIYNPAGIILGDVIFKDLDKRRVVSNLDLTATALKGSGLIKNFSFPVQEQSIVTALQPNSTNILAVNKLGNVYTTTSLPSDSVQRAIVKTIAGESNPSVWSSNVTVAASGSLSITVNYPCSTDGYGTVRSDYPDVIAGNTKGLFNPTSINIYIDDGITITKLTNNAVIPGINQVFNITDTSSGIVTILPSNSDTSFSLFAPGTVTATASTGGSLTAGTYRIAYSFVYNGNQITSISHKVGDGCVSELQYGLIEALQNFKYTWLNGTVDPINTLGNDENYYINTTTKNYYNKVNGVWILLGNLTGSVWITGTTAPSSSLGNIGDLYLNTITYFYQVKTDNTTWSVLGNLKGTNGTNGINGSTWLNGSGLATAPANTTATTAANVGDYYLNTNSGFAYVKTALPNTWTFTANLNGAVWLNGTTVPASGTGAIEDMYINTVTSDYYVKTNSTTWTLLGNLKGITGAVTTSTGVIINNNATAPTKTATQISLYSKAGVPTIVENGGTENTISFTNKQQTYTRSQGTAIVTLTDAASIIVDASLSNTYKVTLAGNRTLNNPTNTVNGFYYEFLIYQDTTGSRTLTFGTNYRFQTPPTLSTGSSILDRMGCICDNGVLYCTLNKGWL